MKYICEKELCTGCGACQNICKQNAIVMKYDSEGFIYPVINQEVCINCGICKTVCPSANAVEKNRPILAYKGSSRNKDYLLHSTSGAIFLNYVLLL